jgi:hypothetical protein
MFVDPVNSWSQRAAVCSRLAAMTSDYQLQQQYLALADAAQVAAQAARIAAAAPQRSGIAHAA